jgi:predicted SprT family Zn-dependent metalloprotease
MLVVALLVKPYHLVRGIVNLAVRQVDLVVSLGGDMVPPQQATTTKEESLPMHPITIKAMARDLMREHHLYAWTVRFDSAVVRAGCCYHRQRLITLSEPLMVRWSEKEVRETILHEIAHALAGPRCGHGPKWKAIARKIGSTGDRCWSPSEDAPAIPPKWLGVCPTCSLTYPRHRRVASLACGKCAAAGWDARHVIRWQRNTQSA